MIEYLYINNYRFFKEASFVLGNHTLFIGTNSSGKTTVLKALDVFFNHTLERHDVRHKQKDVVITCQVNDMQYTKTFSPPHYTLNYKKSSTDLADLTYLAYLYMPKTPHSLSHLYNQLISLQSPAPKQPSPPEILESEPTPIFNQQTMMYAWKIKKSLTVSEEKSTRYDFLKTHHHPKLILGVDTIEQHLRLKDALAMITRVHQVFYVSKQKQFINAFPHSLHPLYQKDMQKEITTLTEPLKQSQKKPFILVEGKYDVPWFENALMHLNKNHQYRVLPCGGFGNIQFVKTQLRKAGYQTLTITDGDVHLEDAYTLKRDVVELYTDLNFLNRRFDVNLKEKPHNKHALFNVLNDSDDKVKSKLASYATNHMRKDNPLIYEVKAILKDYESR